MLNIFDKFPNRKVLDIHKPTGSNRINMCKGLNPNPINMCKVMEPKGPTPVS